MKLAHVIHGSSLRHTFGVKESESERFYINSRLTRRILYLLKSDKSFLQKHGQQMIAHEKEKIARTDKTNDISTALDIKYRLDGKGLATVNNLGEAKILAALRERGISKNSDKAWVNAELDALIQKYKLQDQDNIATRRYLQSLLAKVELSKETDEGLFYNLGEFVTRNWKLDMVNNDIVWDDMLLEYYKLSKVGRQLAQEHSMYLSDRKLAKVAEDFFTHDIKLVQEGMPSVTQIQELNTQYKENLIFTKQYTDERIKEQAGPNTMSIVQGARIRAENGLLGIYQ